MLRSVLGGLVAAVAFIASPAMAQSIPTCKDIALTAPAAGKNFTGTRPIFFSWSGEPVGTASRDLHLASLDGSEVVIPIDGRFSDTVKVNMTGDLAWVVLFRDAAGDPLCTTVAGLLTKGTAGGNAAFSQNSLSSAGSANGRVSVFMNNGRLVIVLQNSPYTGAYSKLVASSDYDGTNEDLMGATGLEIHGNNVRNVVTGSPRDDLIWLYDGDDMAEGGAGDDILVGGAGNDLLTDIAPANIADRDVIYWGPGINNVVDIDDGDSLDTVIVGTGFGFIAVDTFSEGANGGPDQP